MGLKLEGVNNRTSINKIIDMNFFNTKFGTVNIPGKKQILEIINILLLFSPKMANGIKEKDQYTGALSVEQIFYLLMNKEYDETNKKDKNKYKNIESQLKKLSSQYNSMYGDKNLLNVYEKNGIKYYYLTNFRKNSHHNLNYVNFNLGTIDINATIIKEYKNELADLVTAGLIYEITKLDVVFSYGQMENIFGITRSRLKKAFEKLEIITINSRRTISHSEAKQIGFRARIDEGTKIYSCSGIHNDLFKKLYIQLNYSKLADIRKAIVENKQYIKKETLNSIDTMTKNEYNDYTKDKSLVEKSRWYRVDTDMTKGKKIAMQNIAFNGTKDWSYEKEYEKELEKNYGESDLMKIKRKDDFNQKLINDFKEHQEKMLKLFLESQERQIDKLIKALINNNSDNSENNRAINNTTDFPEAEQDDSYISNCSETINDFDSPVKKDDEIDVYDSFKKFCIETRKDFINFGNHNRGIDNFKDYLQCLKDFVNDQSEEVYTDKLKVMCLNSIDSVKTAIDVMTSPLLCENWSKNGNLNDLTLMALFSSWNQTFKPHTVDVNRILLELENEFKQDISQYTFENFKNRYIEKIGYEVSDEEITDIAEYTIDTLDRLKNKSKFVYEDNTKYTSYEVLKMHLNDCQDIDSWVKYLKSVMSETNNKDIKFWLGVFVYNININNYSLIKEIIPSESETKIYNILLDKVKNANISDTDDLKQIIFELSEKGYNIIESTTLDRDIMKILANVKMNDVSVNDAILEYINKN